MFGMNKKAAVVLESNRINAMRDIVLSPDKHTPDKFWLQTRANWLVFLYCDLQLNHMRAIDDCDLVWWGYSKEHLSVWKNDLGKLSHPVAFKPNPVLQDVPHLRVKGQIVRMRTDRLIKLDQERQNGVQFLRKRIPITIPSIMTRRDHKNHGGVYDLSKMDYAIPCEDTVWAWSYVGNPEFWLDSLERVFNYKEKQEDGFYRERSILVFPEREVFTLNKYSPNNNAEPYYYFPPNG
jgi:hypothetical protein